MRRGRGARSNHAGRFEAESREDFDDGWEGLGDLDVFKTEVQEETARTIITRNDSPDISFDRSINAYRGCEHGCVYCYARPTHCYLGHSAGLDFETKLYAKTNAAKLLEQDWRTRIISQKLSRLAPTPIPISQSSASTASRDPYWKYWSAPRIPWAS